MGCGCVELTVMSGDEEEARTYNIVWSVCAHQDRVNEWINEHNGLYL